MKLALAALVTLAFAAGCSKTNTDVVLPAPVESDPTLAPTAADNCYSKCDVDFKTESNKTYDALDLCMEDGCKPTDDEPTDTRAACAGVDQGISYNYAPADHCMARVCCAQATACANEKDCADLSACFSKCSKLR